MKKVRRPARLVLGLDLRKTETEVIYNTQEAVSRQGATGTSMRKEPGNGIPE